MKKLLAVTLVAVAGALPSAHAGLIIDNLDVSTTELTFDVSGTVDVIAPAEHAYLIFGFSDAPGWMTSYTDGSIVTNGGDYSAHGLIGPVDRNRYGTYILTLGNNNLAIGSQVDLSLEITGTFDPSSFASTNFAVQAGFDYADPDQALIQDRYIGGGTAHAAVPEPGSLALLSSGALFFGLSLRRRRARAAT